MKDFSVFKDKPIYTMFDLENELKTLYGEENVELGYSNFDYVLNIYLTGATDEELSSLHDILADNVIPCNINVELFSRPLPETPTTPETPPETV